MRKQLVPVLGEAAVAWSVTASNPLNISPSFGKPRQPSTSSVLTPHHHQHHHHCPEYQCQPPHLPPHHNCVCDHAVTLVMASHHILNPLERNEGPAAKHA